MSHLVLLGIIAILCFFLTAMALSIKTEYRAVYHYDCASYLTES